MGYNKVELIERIYKESKTENELFNKLNSDGFEGNINIVLEACQKNDFEKAEHLANMDGWL